MAEPSIFEQFIAQFMPKLGLYVSEKVNGKSERERTYLHKQRLEPVYSPDQKWEGTSANTRYVAADYVALDAPLPLKKRGRVSSSNGKLPKIGIRRPMNETDINNVNIMQAELNSLTDKPEAYKRKKTQIIKKLADDPTFCAIGIDEKNELAYLYGISNGIVLIEGDENDEQNTGIGMRVNYGYKDENIFHTAEKDVCDGDDFQRISDKVNADGNTTAVAMISKYLLDKIRRTRWARELAADYKEHIYTDNSKLPVPSVKTFTDAFESEFGYNFIVIDRTILCEKNGKDTPVKPFNPHRIIFLPNADKDGSLVYGTLAEMTHPAENVQYNTIDDYKLISRLRVTEPSFAEITKGQAMVLPVIEDVDAIYVLDFSGQAELDDSDATEAGEVDEKITIAGKAYKKADVLTALKNLGSDVKANAKDSTVIRKINELSDADNALLMEAIKDSVYTPPAP
ncbi:MAG: major capsid protein [Muribaculaceae bacterium]|nr:major capsid protein [Muribaculaceae bacterium]